MNPHQINPHQHKTGYEHTYQSIVHKLAECDFNEASQRLGFDPPVNGTIKVNFLGREYAINSEGVTGTDGLPSDPCCRGTLIYYITSKGRGEPEDTYWLPQNFSPIRIGSGDINWMSAPLVKAIGNDPGKLKTAMSKLGAIQDGQSESIWIYSALPKVKLQITFLEADEDFPCEIILKLDKGTGRFFEFEQLAFLCGCFMDAVTGLCKS